MTTLLTGQQTRALGDVSSLYQIADIGAVPAGPLRFGLIADPQYADADAQPEFNRYYRHSLAKLSQAIDQLNQQPLAFVATLGDLVDRDWRSYATVLACYARLHHPHMVITGNHDADVISRQLAAQQPALPLPKHYYQFSLPGYRFIVIDGNDVSLYCNVANGDSHAQARAWLTTLQADGRLQAQSWNGAVGEQQLEWLEHNLQQAQVAGEIVLVFGHYPLTPDNKHNLWNCERVVALLCRYQVRAYFAGHFHRGGYHRIGNTDFITLKGMLDGSEETPFAVVEICGNQLKIEGYGTEISRDLSI
ncbi:3',5'-cyclic AMP phosphodiesterase CpdA [Erwinia toletana]|uniref:3',5'-cyclic AMP phosphodiesterase CpdA n=1 Tax=Winslowiella toletana TaxID=92490 RepID=A0ABS4P8A9_9GAMM|nr:metallophosphoesterase [Winslowiella toletana]MBP2168397.1 3',5'-cyclic AMP phosphodiesterase CpdA [Winslowiella toletana]